MNKKITPVVVSLIRNSAGKYLLTLRTEMDPEDQFNNLWQVPGGGLEWGEKIEDALKREAREEMGIDIEVGPLIKIYEPVRTTVWHGLILCYLCRMKDENQPIVLNEEASDWGWYTAAEIKKLKSYEETVDLIETTENILKKLSV